MKKLIVNPSGCGAREVACSFHNGKNFSRKISSINVKRDEKGEFEPMVFKGKEGKHLAAIFARARSCRRA